MIKMKGAMSTHCTTKRAAVICPTGMLSDASLAATSSKGAVRQNPNIKATPVKVRSVEEGVSDALDMRPHKSIAKPASIFFSQTARAVVFGRSV
ncbi:hypothetical protein [Planktotalea sp.]|uniref:hypothetical protein n=1 Tax=Planktotalea sp. TaxID=2029877 RepID=UPI003F6D20E0